MQVAHGRNCDDLHTALIKLRRIKLDFAGDNDHGWVLASVRIQAKGPDAARDHEANVAITNFVAAAGLHHGRHHFLMSDGEGQQDGLGRIKEAVDVFLQFKHPAIIRANPFKDPIAVQQTVIEH